MAGAFDPAWHEVSDQYEKNGSLLGSRSKEFGKVVANQRLLGGEPLGTVQQ